MTLQAALIGNPNVGKSTLFNALTHTHQHTGNWPGKTVDVTKAKWKDYEITDLPGCYGLNGSSLEETVAMQAIAEHHYDVLMVVADSTCLERNLPLLFQIMRLSNHVLLLLNLYDEALRKGITIDEYRLKNRLGIPVLKMSAFNRKDLRKLPKYMQMAKTNEQTHPPKLPKLFSSIPGQSNDEAITQYGIDEDDVNRIIKETDMLHAKQICQEVVRQEDKVDVKQYWLEKLFVSPKSAWTIMIILFVFILWLTLYLANVPSHLLSQWLFNFEKILDHWLRFFLPSGLVDVLIYGAYRVMAWVVSVMLVPMAIFFPLFGILEDVGYLPRFAFNLDRCFAKCGTCGKQALSMCMGLGCNAVGVMGTRIIEDLQDRRIALLTNSFVPCNGRFPMLMSLAATFIVGSNHFYEAVILGLLLLLSLAMTLLVGKILAGYHHSLFILEMPDFRKPNLKKVIQESFFERTIKVLQRAVVVSAFFGMIIYLLSHIFIHDVSLLRICAQTLDPFASFFGIDGVILLAFILGSPANEIVIPIMLMIYLNTGKMCDTSDLVILRQFGWTAMTAVNVMILTLFHWPCLTTLKTIYQECHDLKLTILSIFLPCLVGFSLMMVVRIVFQLFF